jgi:hypothetical protein
VVVSQAQTGSGLFQALPNLLPHGNSTEPNPGRTGTSLPNPVTVWESSAEFSRPRWFQFDLRALLFVVTLIGCGLGWLGFEV